MVPTKASGKRNAPTLQPDEPEGSTSEAWKSEREIGVEGEGDWGAGGRRRKDKKDPRPPGGRVWRAVYFLKVNLPNGYLANTLWNKAMKLD